MLSVTRLEKCPCCSSENVVKNGFTQGGNQRVLCHDCLKSRVLHRKISYEFDFESVRRSFLERMSLCGVSWVSLISYCGFCQKKKNKQWIWAALSRNTRQVVAYVIGDRSELTFKRLIRKIPLEYLKCQSFSDYWKSYAILKAKQNHKQVGK